MRRYSEAIKADVRRPMSPPNRQSVARISEETGIHIATLYLWRKGWRLEAGGAAAGGLGRLNQAGSANRGRPGAGDHVTRPALA
jgi:transposase-like protein